MSAKVERRHREMALLAVGVAPQQLWDWEAWSLAGGDVFPDENHMHCMVEESRIAQALADIEQATLIEALEVLGDHTPTTGERRDWSKGELLKMLREFVAWLEERVQPAAEERGVARERAAVVACLRNATLPACPDVFSRTVKLTCENLADDIERGEHIVPEIERGEHGRAGG